MNVWRSGAWSGVVALLAGLLGASAARADAGAAGAGGAMSVASATLALDAGPPAEPPHGSCQERIPAGKQAPVMREQWPARGISGHAAVLELTIEHGLGETVLPHGLSHQLGGEEMQVVEGAQFFFPHPDGGAGPTIERQEGAERATTRVRIAVVPLPTEPGRQELTLPPLPIAISRASGEMLTLCTREHRLVVEDPIANTPHPEPRPNPPPRRQLEEWTTAKHVTYAALAALLVGALVAWLVGRWLRRPRPAPPPPPPRPPWEVAFEALHDLRLAGLISDGRFAEHYDRVSFTVRCYLGDRYGFDGLECTTREMLSTLGRVVPGVEALPEIKRFLQQADLVKFARLTPSAAECEQALGAGEIIVRRTVPPLPAPSEPGAAAHAPPSDGKELG